MLYIFWDVRFVGRLSGALGIRGNNVSKRGMGVFIPKRNSATSVRPPKESKTTVLLSF